MAHIGHTAKACPLLPLPPPPPSTDHSPRVMAPTTPKSFSHAYSWGHVFSFTNLFVLQMLIAEFVLHNKT